MDIQILLSRISREMIFWMAWIIIPLIMEIIPAIGGFFYSSEKEAVSKETKRQEILPWDYSDYSCL